MRGHMETEGTAVKMRDYRVGIMLGLWLLLGSGPGNATEQAPARQPSLGTLPVDLWRDAVALPTTGNAWWLLSGAALTAAAHEIEDPAGATRTLDQGAIDKMVDAGNIWGNILVQAPLALGLWGYGAGTDNADLTDLGYDLTRGLLLSYGFVSGLKTAFNRTRPNGEDYSFPSGHTASAFTTAGVVSRRYGGWAGGLAIGAGVLAGLGRMEDMKHFASDVVAGATIGWICGRNAAREQPPVGLSWRLVPMARGVAVAGSF